MTLLLYEPFDEYELNSTVFRTKYGMGGSNTSTLTRNQSGITGRPSGSIFMIGNNISPYTSDFSFQNSHREIICYVAVYPVTNVSTALIEFRNMGTLLFGIAPTPSTTTIYNSIGTIFSSTATVRFNSWNFLEIRSVISSASLGSGSVQIKNNGQLLFSASGLNVNASNVFPAVNVFRIDNRINPDRIILIDDLLILNTSGVSFNTTQMTSSGATTDANAINERPNDGDTSYLIASASGIFPLRETFTLRPANTASVFSTIPISSSIEAVLKKSIVRADGPDLMGVEHLLRINSTDYTGSNAISASITYTDQFTGWEINPNTGNKFRPAEFNSLEVGFKRDS